MRWPTSSRSSSGRRTRVPPRPGRAIPGIDPGAPGTRPSSTRCSREIEIRGAALVAEAKVGFGTTPSLTPGGAGAQALCVAPVRDRDQQRLRGHAGRFGDDCRPRRNGGAQRARRRVARRVGRQRRDAAPVHQLVAADDRGRARPARTPGSSEPGRRQSVLARTLHRARRLDHARVAHLPEPPAGGQRAAAGVARQPDGTGNPALQGGRQGSRASGSHGRRPHRAAGAQPHDVGGLVLSACRARSTTSTASPALRATGCRWRRGARSTTSTPAGAGAPTPCPPPSAIRCACSTTACACWRRSTA